MSPSVFEDKTHPPAPSEIERTLGESARLWSLLVSHVADRYPPVHELWHFSGEEKGWSLRLKRGEKIVLSLTPQAGRFLVGVESRGKQVTVASRADLREARALAVR